MSRLAFVTSRVWTRRRSVLAFSVPFTVLATLVLTPGITAVFRGFLVRWGRPSIGNFEIASFLLSPIGIAALLLVGSALLALLYLELVGLLRVLGDPPVPGGRALLSLFGKAPRIVRVALRQAVVLIVFSAPFLLAIAGALKALWAGHDLNALLVLRPPAFWYGVAAGAAGLLAWLCAVLYVALRWLFVLPLLRDDPQLSAPEAFRASRERTKGRTWAHARVVLACIAVLVVASSVLFGALHLLSGSILDRVGTSMAVALPVTALLVAIHFLLGLAISILTMASVAGLVDRLYREAQAGVAPSPARTVPADAEAPLPPPLRWRLLAALALLAVVATFAAHRLISGVRLDERIEITAHRGGAIAAPENTVAAIRRAIEDRADWAEIDVQRTLDDAIVVLHDFDLVRIGGPSRRVRESTLADIRAIDVGKALGRGAPGERVPTLEEVVAAAGDRIGLNIELKPAGAADVAPLTDAVIAIARRAGPALRYRICSQSYEGIQRARKAVPGLEVGFIAGASIGDLTRLEVGYLMVQPSVTTRRFVEEAHARGIKVHVWTINDPDALLPLLDVGVDDVITDAPAPMRARLEEIRALESPERLLLRARTLLSE